MNRSNSQNTSHGERPFEPDNESAGIVLPFMLSKAVQGVSRNRTLLFLESALGLGVIEGKHSLEAPERASFSRAPRTSLRLQGRSNSTSGDACELSSAVGRLTEDLKDATERAQGGKYYAAC